MLLLIGCGRIQQEVVVKNEYIERDIPKELFILKPLKKTYAKDDKDIVFLYSILYERYKECEVKLNKVNELLNEKME